MRARVRVPRASKRSWPSLRRTIRPVRSPRKWRRHAAAHDRVVAIEPHGDAFAVEDFLPHPVVDEALQLLGTRRSLPDTLGLLAQVRDLPARDEDLVRRGEHAALQ